ncbi:MAG: hypothetical protein ACP5E4_00325 [Candidatus Aenigmatarchaeota archaeon]
MPASISSRDIARIIRLDTKNQKELFDKRIEKLSRNFNQTKKLFLRNKKAKAIDEWMFSSEDLPLFGKEYWWMLFTSTKKNSKDQLVATFGRSQGKVTVNDSHIPPDPKNKETNAAVVWAYKKGKKPIINSSAKVVLGENNLRLTSKSTEFLFQGKFPNYGIKIIKEGKTLCDLELYEPEGAHKPYEFSEYFKGVFGYQLLNLFLDFKGSLLGEPIEGKVLLQKVIGIGPFIPWKWGRIVFSNGSFLSFFRLRLGELGINYDFLSSLYFYNSKTNETCRFNNVKITEFCPESPLWTVHSTNKCLVVAKTYSEEPFQLQARGKFRYLEYLSEVKELYLESGDEKIHLKDLGSGIGMLENATGYLL